MIVLPQGLRGRMLLAARAALPSEACGLLIGRADAEGWRVEALAEAGNVATEPRRRFEIDPVLLLAWHRRLRGSGRGIVGVYHSHPQGPAAPSATDAAMAWDVDLIWVIIAPVEGGTGRIGAWRPAAGGFAPVPIAWIGEDGRLRAEPGGPEEDA